MKSEKPISVFLVDDDAVFLKALEIQFVQDGGFSIETFATGESCLENIHKNPDIVVLDYHLNSISKKAINGLETLDLISAYNKNIPVIILSAQDKIEVAVSCMRHNAFDYVIKNETSFLRLKKNINGYFRYQKIERALNWYMDRM
jgi:DNA-binding NtrC family response regulator